MRIKSDFHDFYDCAQAYGQDQSLVYIRKKIDFPVGTELKVKKLPFSVPKLTDHRGYTRVGELPSYTRFYIVGVAGKIYPVFEFVWDYAEEHSKDCKVFCYSMADIEKVIATRCSKKYKDLFNGAILEKKRYNRWSYHMPFRKSAFEDFFSEWNSEDQAAKVQALFRQYPVWVIEHRHDGWYVCYNCSLKEVKFFKVKDAVTTYQEIAMFLGGLAVPQKPIPVPSDKDMVGIKGFDKFSFRKDPSTKKKR
jgi:hypothetical protein